MLGESNGAYTVELTLDGFVIIRKKGRRTRFDVVARLALDMAGEAFSAEPVFDESHEVERVRIALRAKS